MEHLVHEDVRYTSVGQRSNSNVSLIFEFWCLGFVCYLGVVIFPLPLRDPNGRLLGGIYWYLSWHQCLRSMNRFPNEHGLQLDRELSGLSNPGTHAPGYQHTALPREIIL